MDPNSDHHRLLLHVAMYAIFVGIVGILMQSIIQLSEPNPKNKIVIGISLASLVMNFVASLWVFCPTGDVQQVQHIRGKAMVLRLIFEFTGILSPYLAFYVLLPQWITWHGFVIVCMVLTLWKGYNMIRFMLTWFYEKFDITVKFVTNKFSLLILRCESSAAGDV